MTKTTKNPNLKLQYKTKLFPI